MTKVCYQDGGAKRADLPIGDGTVLHNDVLFVRPTAPENNIYIYKKRDSQRQQSIIFKTIQSTQKASVTLVLFFFFIYKVI